MMIVRPVDYYLTTISTLTPDFVDDGLSWFPDWIYKYILRHNITPAGRVHDWHYCSRCHRRGAMDQAHRTFADKALRVHARELLHGHFRIAPLVLWMGVRWRGGGSAWNSCGRTRGTRCRHNMLMPGWMRQLAKEEP
jgi:hypothetical protein